jgi:eukaryotic-like serine/threonine-protein kinase
MSTTIEESKQPAELSFRELVVQFEGLPDDFKVLKKELRSIGIAATPEHALTSARRALEYIVQDVYKRRFQVPSNKLGLAEMIEKLKAKKQLPRGMYQKADYIREVGNYGGAHPEEESSASAGSVSNMEVRSGIGLLATLVEWYVKARQTGELDRQDVISDEKRSPKLPLAIVPRGLHSFGASDSKFFLKLLPGPFRENGLPENIHFWKEAVEGKAPFPVGVIIGRSGCGKSSLVKAGLLPLLANTVKKVYVEATTNNTDRDILIHLRKQIPTLPQDLNLEAAIKALCEGGAAEGKGKSLLEKKQKVLIVIDQFEQWLHAHRGKTETRLVRALGQCDGDRVQALILVRDDFNELIAEFMAEMAQPLKEGENCKWVALFKQDHARQVLAAYGRGYEKLGEELTPEQEAFLDEVIQGLSQDHRVICVRLALFAQMFHSKKWNLEELKAVGGIEGIGTRFLEETFNSTSGDTEKYRKHKDGAIAILKALLPEEGADIKGGGRSAANLMEDAGYQTRPQEFERLLGYLDSDLRLISPTTHGPAGMGSSSVDEPAEPDLSVRYYQLTHDYLVPSLRKWLTSKLQETRRGRAGLLLKARASNWKNSRRDDRHIPTAREYVVIRALTRPREWNDDQRVMMHHARNVYLRKVLVLQIALLVLGVIGVGFLGASYAEATVGTLIRAHIREVPDVIQKLSGYHRWADPILLKYRTDPEDSERADQRKLRAALALLSVEPSQLSFLREYLLDRAGIDEVPILCRQLSDHRDELVGPLWQRLEDRSKPFISRFRAAMALARFAAPDEATTASSWAKSAQFIADEMVKRIVDEPNEFKTILDMLKPVHRHLVGPLSAAFLDPKRPHHTRLADILAQYAADDPKVLTALVVGARDPEAFKKVFESLREKSEAGDLLESLLDAPSPAATIEAAKREAAAKQKANAAVALYMLKRFDRVWPLLKPAPDPRVRSYIIDHLSLMQADPGPIVQYLEHLSTVSDDETKQAMILSLGEFKGQMQEAELNGFLPDSKRLDILRQLEYDYREAADPGVRGAAEWMLRTWGRGDSLSRIDESLKRPDPDRHRDPKGRRWFVNAEGQTMIVVPKAGSFKIGPRRGEPIGYDTLNQPTTDRDETIGYPFAIGAHEVTLEEFLRFKKNHAYTAKDLKPTPTGEPDPRCPVNNIFWYEAAEYCNWLSQKDGIPEDQWCYRPHDKTKKYASGMRIAPNFTELTGYRLPTEAEWEYSCRAGTIGVSRYYGEADELLVKYVWFAENSGKMLWPVGSKMPNTLGLFDTLGNALEWCQDAYHPAGQAVAAPDDSEVKDNQIRVLRGEKMLSFGDNIRAARHETTRLLSKPRDYICGFRVARTYRP